jgi:hypothetical protein
MLAWMGENQSNTSKGVNKVQQIAVEHVEHFPIDADTRTDQSKIDFLSGPRLWWSACWSLVDGNGFERGDKMGRSWGRGGRCWVR